ncbi:CPBP family glutamic-type intramembrane protease [Sphingosinicella sp. YJ22]|uniref:CPBP family glutamic-type intramembrane protease n=1 Tax=Sphingosinicella sp. YJ22 TaxID=1104780 RepID=UPI0014089803|nr:CPBP family glutamic-type intramembrane protease [Sphingosinicella sp. YJ22]
MRKRTQDILAALRTWPDRAGWWRAAMELLWSLPLLLLIAWCAGLIAPATPPPAEEFALLALTLLVAPALGEELLFRATLIPRERPSTVWVALSVLLFVAWHPLQAITIGPPWAPAFLDPWFLACVAVLGAALARIYTATRSIWPYVLTHWAVVFGWKAFLGGPF